MNCGELDEFLDRCIPVSKWPVDAQLHLDSCARCRALEAAFSRLAPAPAAPQDYSAIAKQIVSGLAPVRPLPPPQVGVLLLMFCVAGIGTVLAAATGNKGWMALEPVQRVIIFLTATVAIAVNSALVALEMEPGRSRAQAIRHLSWLAPAAFAGIAVGLFRWAPGEMFNQHWALCAGRAAATALVVFGGVYSVVCRGYFVDLRRAGAALGLLAGLGGFVCQELYCPLLETAHVAAAHVGLLAISTAAGYLLGAAADRRRQSKFQRESNPA